MIVERLNDAAIALHRVLSRRQIKFGIFGGYAVTTLGGFRESKDVDCIASVSKEQVIQLLNEKDGFYLIPQSRADYVAFFWSDRADRNKEVLVEIFCDQFPGSRFSLNNVPCSAITIKGSSLGQGDACFLEPFYLFKGKLCAAASRDKFHDSADLRVLANNYHAALKPRAHELNPVYIGLCLRRYPELHRLFERLGVDVEKAKQAAEGINPDPLATPAPGEVQSGLLG
ncbi:hypothetical protein E4U41_002021 [Claviceps citrina]|nr:hypothetical protein E4U41_002021 [Claviceps citrina]